MSDNPELSAICAECGTTIVLAEDPDAEQDDKTFICEGCRDGDVMAEDEAELDAEDEDEH